MAERDPIESANPSIAGPSKDDSYEEARLRALNELELLDTPESEGFDRITRTASRLFVAPISAVSLTDRARQWFKSSIGTDGNREIPREGAPCAEVTRTQALLVIPDLLKDARFQDCLLAKAGIRFYAGAPLRTRDGYVLGAMCVLDKEPRCTNRTDEEEYASLHDLASMVIAQIELQHDLGRIDPFSRLPNRGQMIEDLEDFYQADPRPPVATVFMDLMDSRQLNQIVTVLGTTYLDELIRASSRHLQQTLGHKRGIYQVGQTSFGILVNEAEDVSARQLVDQLGLDWKEPLACNGVPVPLHPVFGISPSGYTHPVPSDALRAAVTAAYEVRETDIDWAIYTPELDQANQRRFTLLTDIKEALKQPGELALVYQPKIDLKSRSCSSAEALLRWNHPRFGAVSPGEFIPLIEQTALVRPVTHWCLETAISQVAEWQRIGLAVKVSINISALDLESPDFAQRVETYLLEKQVSPDSIELEFTESALIRKQARVLSQLKDVRALGIRLAIDDFGTGYSAFSYLQKLPADTLKIDQSFVPKLAESERDRSLVRSMIGMAHDLGFRVVAEGVETQAVFNFLQDADCDEIQGYFVSRPLSAAGFAEWFRNQPKPTPGGPYEISRELNALASSVNRLQSQQRGLEQAVSGA